MKKYLNLVIWFSTLTCTVLWTELDIVCDIAFTVIGISPRMRGLMGMWMDAPSWLLTDTCCTFGTASSKWSVEAKSKVSLSATITVTWEHRQNNPRSRETRVIQGEYDSLVNCFKRHSKNNENLGHHVLRGCRLSETHWGTSYNPTVNVSVIQRCFILLLFHCDRIHREGLI